MDLPPPPSSVCGEAQAIEVRDSVHGAMEALARALHVVDVTVRLGRLTLCLVSKALSRALLLRRGRESRSCSRE
jgi:hypothetical protein